MPAVKQSIKYVGVVSVEDKHRYAGLGNKARGFKLCDHAARSAFGSVSARVSDNAADILDARNDASIGILSRVAVEKSVNIGEIEQNISAANKRDICRELVVSAEVQLLCRY